MRHRASVAVLLALLLSPAAAVAAPLPHPRSPHIAVPTAIGGVRLGQSLHNAERAWGKDVCGKVFCEYGKFGNGLGTASIEADDGVSFVGIYAGLKKGSRPSFRGPLMRFETGEGIGLRSPISKLERAYPQAHRAESGWQVDGPHGSYMRFGASGVRVKGKTRIVSISIWR
jgi:hypothetical protein